MFRSEPRQHRSSETMSDRMHSDQAQPAATLLKPALGGRPAGCFLHELTQGPGTFGLRTGPGRLLRRPQRV
jgi:hypothetical protein